MGRAQWLINLIYQGITGTPARGIALSCEVQAPVSLGAIDYDRGNLVITVALNLRLLVFTIRTM